MIGGFDQHAETEAMTGVELVSIPLEAKKKAKTNPMDSTSNREAKATSLINVNNCSRAFMGKKFTSFNKSSI